jgi:hypothetical protein
LVNGGPKTGPLSINRFTLNTYYCGNFSALFNLRFSPAIIWFITTTILLTLPGSAIPKEDWLDRIWFDKWVHIGIFFTLVVLWNWALSKSIITALKKKKYFIWIALGALVYGIAMEFVQKYFIPNRSFDTGDILADAAGCGVGLVYSISRYIKK